MVEILEPVHLLLVKVVHLVRSNYIIAVQVNHLEPVLYGLQSRLVFFVQHKPHEILIIHFILRFAL